MSYKIVKGTGLRKGTYLVKNNNYVVMQFVTLAEANRYVNLQKKRIQFKKQLDKIDNQIYNTKVDYNRLSDIYQKNKKRLPK